MYALLHLATGSKSIIHFLMKCVYKEYVYVNQTLMEEAIYIPVHLPVPVLHLDFGRNEKERRRRTKAIDGGVGGRSMVILNLSYAGKRLAARMSDTNLTVNRLIIALLNFHIPPPSLEEEMEESITGRTDVARGDHPEFGSQKMQKTQAKDAMMTYLPAHCSFLIPPFPMLIIPFAACFGHEYSYLRQA